MKAIRLTLVSHARTQAQKTGRFHCPDDSILPEQVLVPVEPGVMLVTAPEARARATAELLGQVAQVDERLADCNLGRWRGVALKQLQANDSEGLSLWLADPAAAPHGGESITELCQRIGTWLAAQRTPGDWFAVTHPWVIRAAMIEVLGCPLAAFHRIDVLPLSRLELTFSGQWRVRLA
ncbi:histidine phosphatase family protein [Pseudomonas sp. X10]